MPDVQQIDATIAAIKERNAQKAAKATAMQQHTESQLQIMDLQRTVLESFQALVHFLAGRTSKVEITNQLTEIGTPDALEVVKAIEALEVTVKDQPQLDLSGITEILQGVLDEAKQLPKELPKPADQIDYSKQFNALEKAVKAVDASIAAKELQVNVEAPVVNVPAVEVPVPDLEPYTAQIKSAFAEAIKQIVFPENKTDTTKIEKKLEKLVKLFDEFLDAAPTGGGGGGGGRVTPYQTDNDAPSFVNLNPDQSVPTSDKPQAVRFLDHTTLSGIAFMGKAVLGADPAAAVWQIAKFDTSSGFIKTWADGDAQYNNVWDNRELLTYN